MSATISPWDRVRAAIADAIIWRDATAGDWDDVNAGYLDAILAAYSAAGGNATAELTRLKAAQLEHDRTVRLAALDEAAKIADSAGSFWRGHPNGAHARAIAKGIRSLIDQTGGEGGI